MNALEISGLIKCYRGNVKALDNLMLVVPKGEVVGLIGPNGAGKSTTINILAGLLHADAGDITVLGKTLDTDDVNLKRRIGYVLERSMLFEKLTAWEYLRFVGIMYNISPPEVEHRVADLVDYFDLRECGSRYIESYSAGTKKKISLAAAIIHNPDLLILDEPLEGVDPMSAIRMKEILRSLAHRGSTILISSHALDTVEKICSAIAIIHRGQILLQATLDELQKAFRSRSGNGERSLLEEVFIHIIANNTTEPRRGGLSWLNH
jgi:ABC-2 type transport system ATP-binding protein